MTFSDLEKKQHFIASYFINGLIQGMHVSYFIMSLKLKSGPMKMLERLLALNCATKYLTQEYVIFLFGLISHRIESVKEADRPCHDRPSLIVKPRVGFH